jgi:hypothetical protein
MSNHKLNWEKHAVPRGNWTWYGFPRSQLIFYLLAAIFQLQIFETARAVPRGKRKSPKESGLLTYRIISSASRLTSAFFSLIREYQSPYKLPSSLSLTKHTKMPFLYLEKLK